MSTKMNNYNFTRVLFIILGIKLAHCVNRTIHTALNPGCGSICVEKNLTTAYIFCEGPNDTLHYIWDFTGKPSVLFAVTSPTAQLQIDWEMFLWGKESSVKFSEPAKYSFGLVVDKIYEFNDLDDTGLINTVNHENINVLHTKRFRWDLKSHAQNDKYYELSMEGTNYKSGNITRSGSIKFLLNRFWTLDHSDILPHILHSENATQIDVIIENFQTNSSFENSRFAVELLIIGDHSVNSSMNINVKQTLDDEHTPGIFEMVEIRMPLRSVLGDCDTCNNQMEGGYLQWRPVSYTAADRDVTSSTKAQYYALVHVDNHVQSANNSLLYSFYGYTVDKILLEKINISLGSKGDGFYKKGNYSSWTFTMGYGTAPDEQFSFLVIMIISIGLGLPAIIVVAAGLYMCARRRHKKKDSLSLNS
ncbi:glycosylated lysosomal membrane protein B-like [Athalia rosae]|uniref:glycosylated lysosomal membrane protein B-like n=1 Tax=Athalia rosae TaxID=37344 RepID=UPI002033CAD0|nr:glycosylated lysosomal membrane protein B-like [Athalia rosae]